MSHHQPHISDYLRVVYKRRWMAILMFLIVFLYGAVSSLRKTPIYEASTQLLIEVENRRNTSLNAVLQDPGNWYDDDFYQTQYRILQSRALAWKAIQAMGIDTPAPGQAGLRQPSRTGLIDWVADLVGAPEPIALPPGDETTWQSQQVDAFLGGLAVVPVRNSRLVDVRYRSADPLLAARAANQVAAAYRSEGTNARMMASREANEFLQTALDEQRTRVQEAEEALQSFREQYGTVAVADGQSSFLVQEFTDLSAQLTQARLARTEKEAVYRRLQAVRNDPVQLEAFAPVFSNPAIQQSKADLADLRSRDAQLEGQGFGERFPARRDLASQIATKEQELQRQISQVIDSVESQFMVAQSQEQSLSDQLEQQRSVNLSFDRHALRYAELERDAQSNRQLYDNLMLRAQETGVTGEYRGSNVQVVDIAEVPRAPVLPNRRRDLTVAFLAGLLLAVTLVFGLEYLDNRIKTPDEIKTHLEIPFLGIVPSVSDKETGGKSPLLDNGAPPAFAEAIRSIRTAVVFSSAADGARTVVVTSTAPSEGKTLVSSNLASALGQAEQRTLIIDGDMRRPRIHEVFGCAQEPGLSNVLVGTADLKTALRATGNSDLTVLPAGHIPPNPAELLGSAKYRRLLEELGKQFDWIIIDAPPVMAVTDAAVVSNGASGVVFVIGAEMTPRKTAQTAIEQLTSARAKMIGAVLNRVNVEKHSYYYAPYHRKDYTRAYVRTE